MTGILRKTPRTKNDREVDSWRRGQGNILAGLVKDRLIELSDTNALGSVLDLTKYIAGTVDRITVTNDGDGSVTINLPNDLTLETLTLDKLIFNLVAGLTPSEGQLCWNGDDGTLNLGLPGGSVVLQIGQEVLAPRSKATGSDISNGQLVYVSGASGAVPLMTLAKADAGSTATGTIAMATEDITQNQLGYYTAFGLVRDVDTSAYSAGDILYLSPTTAGGYTDVKPNLPDYTIKIGIVIRSHATEGSILVNIQQRTNNACNINRNFLTPATQTVNTGTLVSGTVSDVQTWADGNEVHIAEVTGVPGFDIEYTFTSIISFCEVEVAFYYVGSATHDCQVQIYDDANTTWRELISQNGVGLSHNLRFVDFPGVVADYINSSDEVKMRFYHPQSGNASHDLYIDFVSIVGQT